MKNLEVKDVVNKSEATSENKLILELNDLLVGLPTHIVLNILASYLAHSLVDLHGPNKSEIFKTLDIFKTGALKIACELIKDRKVN